MLLTRSRPILRILLIAGLLVSLLNGPGLAAETDDPVGLDDDLVEEVLEVIGERYVDEAVLNDDNLTEGAIRGIIEALGDDGHTVYLTPEELEVERDALEGRVVGIGVVVDQRAGSTHIISVVDGSPADLAGLQAGDVITSVDGAETARLPIGDLGELVRGDVGTKVELGIERPGASERLSFTITRDDVEVVPAAWAFVPGSDVAVVRVVQFSSQAGRRTRGVIEEALEAGATGLVLDLRGNPGGLVDEALIVASSFLRQGVAYQEQGREGPARPVHVTGSWTIAPDVPLVVLVDYGTASSAEILAVALRDNDRAPIVGEQTFGTGTVLNTFGLSDGSALRVGVRNWLTPDGEAVFRIGVSPDEVVELPLGAVALEPGDLLVMSPIEFADSDDVPLRHAVRLLEAELVG
jgi:carboxyl-terminal processing protease